MRLSLGKNVARNVLKLTVDPLFLPGFIFKRACPYISYNYVRATIRTRSELCQRVAVLFLFAARIRLYGKTRLSLTYFRDKRRNRRKDSVRNVDNFAMLV